MKEKLILVALRYLCKEGSNFKIERLSINEKISKKTIYKYFFSKEALIMESINYVFNDIEKQQMAIYQSKIDSLDKLRLILKVYPEVFNFSDSVLCGILKTFPKMQSIIDNYFSEKWGIIKMVYEDAEKDGKIVGITFETFKLVAEGMLKNVINFDNQKVRIEDSVNLILRGLMARSTNISMNKSC